MEQWQERPPHGRTHGQGIWLWVMPFLQATALMGNANQGLRTGRVASGLQAVGDPSAAKSQWLVGVAGVAGQQPLWRVRARQDWNPVQVVLQRVKPGLQASDTQMQGVTRQLW
ncbi:hypothetical protein Vafri_12978 [Volvox africanus]|nr:hypothetical protein Vafri_12978 [Volvox africanus]